MLKLLVEWTLLAFGLEIAHRVFREISIISGAEYFINLNDYFNQWSTKGRRSSAEFKGFSPSASTSAAKGLCNQRRKVWPKVKIF